MASFPQVASELALLCADIPGEVKDQAKQLETYQAAVTELQRHVVHLSGQLQLKTEELKLKTEELEQKAGELENTKRELEESQQDVVTVQMQLQEFVLQQQQQQPQQPKEPAAVDYKMVPPPLDPVLDYQQRAMNAARAQPAALVERAAPPLPSFDVRRCSVRECVICLRRERETGRRSLRRFLCL